ncbi:MAG: type I-U CRISPR-associated protein Csx17 [Bacteroidota bacterium]|nr:type I-U CRISPR-associated protein Csx17 [Bacteroidota bacterium]
MVNQVTLYGCSPTPIASYLKALGVLRLLSCAGNSVTGVAADPHVRGWWRGVRFHLLTALDLEGILEFFLTRYAPSPVLAPWNGGSGFYPNDKKDGIKHLVVESVDDRFAAFAHSVRIAQDIIREFGLTEKPGKDTKPRLVERLRASLPESALPWLDASLVLSGTQLRFPPVLGTGGNDGRLEFTNNLMQRLFSKTGGIFNAADGTPRPPSAGLLTSSLCNTPEIRLAKAKVGQFSPGGAGGPNASTGFAGGSIINSWDYVFMLEGASVFASAATRRYESKAKSAASFPFTVDASSAGWGGIEGTDEADARPEFWAPLWAQPARFREIQALFCEGRAVIQGRTATDGLEFVRALSVLGVSRGFSEFQRYGYFQRAGKSYYAVAIGRRSASASPGAKLIADLDRGGWLRTVRQFGRREKQVATVTSAVRELEEALFELLVPEISPHSVCGVLMAIGKLGVRLSTCRPKKDVVVPRPPPLLSYAWTKLADDGSPEFRIAASLAGLGLPPHGLRSASVDDGLSARHCAPPMAAHFVRLTNPPGDRGGFETATFFKGRKLRSLRNWGPDSRPPVAVWGPGSLVTNMITVLERRLLEASVRGLEDKPLASATLAQLRDVEAFLSEGFDDPRCSDLLAGLVWARPAVLEASRKTKSRLPFAYAAVKPVVATDCALVRLKAIPAERSVPIPTGTIQQLRAGGRSFDGRAINQVVLKAFERARSSGMPSPYAPRQSTGGGLTLLHGRCGVGIRPDRLAAALLIPISDFGLRSLLQRAYPGIILETD